MSLRESSVVVVDPPICSPVAAEHPHSKTSVAIAKSIVSNIAKSKPRTYIRTLPQVTASQLIPLVL